MDTATESADVQTVAPPHPESEGLAAVLTAAVDLARTAVVEFSGDTVGEYLGVNYEDTNAATHRFLADVPGYRGWQWAVVVAAYPGADHATVSEVVLVPGPTALLAPQWVPWEQRVKPGDLSPGDLLAPIADDPRLVPGFLLSGDPEVDEVAAEIGFGRRTVLGAWGRAEAAQRWRDGDHGPQSAMARSTRRVCRDCGFLLPLAGSLGTMFGVCGNELAADGHVVDFTYGCGAHSDTPAPAGAGSPLYDPYDDGVLDVIEQQVAEQDATEEPDDRPEPAAEPAAEESVAEEPVADESVPEEAPPSSAGSPDPVDSSDADIDATVVDAELGQE